MVHTHTYRNITWIDLASPTHDEVREVMEAHGIHPGIAENLLEPTSKARIESYGPHNYFVLHFPAIRHSHEHGKHHQEIDFVIGKNLLVTTHYDSIDALHQFGKLFEASAMIDNDGTWDHAGDVLYALVHRLYEALNHELDYVADELRDIEAAIFAGEERAMVFELSRVSRILLRFRQGLINHHRIISELETSLTTLFGKSFSAEAKEIGTTFDRVMERIAHHSETLHELRVTNAQLLSTKQNETMKIIAAVSFFILPLNLIAAIFTMRAEPMPIVNNEHSFFIITGMMLITALCALAYFRRKNWL